MTPNASGRLHIWCKHTEMQGVADRDWSGKLRSCAKSAHRGTLARDRREERFQCVSGGNAQEARVQSAEVVSLRDDRAMLGPLEIKVEKLHERTAVQ
jgi:hypothetical protein